jgi:hypothetical protein
MVSHPVQPVLPLPTASLLLFLLRPPVDHLGQQPRLRAHEDDLARWKLCGSPADSVARPRGTSGAASP